MTPTLQVKTLRFKAMKNALFFGKSVALLCGPQLFTPPLHLGLFMF